MAEKTIYHDTFLDKLFIRLFVHKMSNAVGESSDQSGYDGVVALSEKIMRGRNAQQQQQLVAVVLQSMVPEPVLWGIRTFFSPTQLVCELNAWFASQLFEWLVGPCEVQSVEVTTATGETRQQNSNVHIKKCRYLEQSGCVGMCINMCKLPTQDFFTEKFGIPLTMTPNFDDLSCDMVFGQVPPALETEDAYHQPCLRDCAVTSEVPACPKVRT